MTAPRLSTIPAGAVFDRSLEPRDLHVLCLLGIHTDKFGWCFKSQVVMAEELACGRSSIQRSLERLYTAGWVERHFRSKGRIVADTGRPHAAHAYRVKLDRTDVSFELLDDSAESEEFDQSCPPVGRGCPPMAGTGCPPIRGHMNVDSNVDESEIALAIADEIAVIAGVDPKNAPAAWSGSGPGMRVLAYLNEGYTREHLIAGAQRCMAGKRDGPPRSIEYFKNEFARARGVAEAPIPQSIKPDERVNHGPTRDSSLKGALSKLKDDIERLRQDEVSGGGPHVAGLLPER